MIPQVISCRPILRVVLKDLRRARLADEVGPVYHASGEMTALMFAAREGHMDTIKVLTEGGDNLDALAGDGKDAQSLAIFNGNYAVASYLIDNGAALNTGCTLLHATVPGG